MRLVTLLCSLLALSACSMFAASNPPYLVYFRNAGDARYRREKGDRAGERAVPGSNRRRP